MIKLLRDISTGDWVLSRSGRWHQVIGVQNMPPKKLIDFTCGHWVCGPIDGEYEVDSKPLNKCKHCLRMGRR